MLRKKAFSDRSVLSGRAGDGARERRLDVLRAVVRAFSEFGQPVGSKAIAQGQRCRVSSATIRSAMSELEQLGYLHRPHPSAGRVPTVAGFRAYAQLLLEEWHERTQSLDSPGLPAAVLSRSAEMPDFLRETSRALSHMSGCIGLVLRPRMENARFRAVKFVRLASDRVVAVIVSDNTVADRVFRLPEDYSQVELDRIANYLVNRYSGHSLAEVQRAVQQELAQVRLDCDAAMRRILSLALSSLDRCLVTQEIYLDGGAHCLQASDFEDVEGASQLLRLYEEKDRVARLLARCLELDGVQIRIGDETLDGADGFAGLAFVAAQFGYESSTRGSVGIIGPMRMAYERVIPMVEKVASDVGSALRDGYGSANGATGR